MNDTIDTNYNGWTGQYFRSWQFGNPLMASIQGVPFQVRGTDPASSAETLDWAANGMQSGTPAAVASNGSGPLDWLLSKEPEWLKNFALAGTGVFIGLALLVVGLLFLWKD